MIRKQTIKAAMLWAASVGLWSSNARAETWQMNVRANQPGARINPSLYGLMTEEINHAYDGGLYAELVQNRSFKDNPDAPAHWSIVQEGGGTGSISLDKTNGVNAALNVSLKLDANPAGGRVGVANEGFWGIPVYPRTPYRASFYARATGGGPLTVSIESNDGHTTYAQARVAGVTPQWKKYTVTLRTGRGAPSLNNRLVITTRQAGTVWLSFVSLFPPTYHNRPNGNRIDLMQKLAAMNPSFLRFPGGNYLDPGHYPWKITLGPVDQRPGHPGAWGYRASDGLGVLEFLEWCEDLQMEPLLAVSVGRGWLPNNADVSPLVQDALDEIEYVSGDKSTPWGARRAADGHPAPFKLRYVEVGNEDFFDPLDVYEARFAKFFDAIRARYPQLKIIATRGDLKTRRPDIVDDHIYANFNDMLRASHNYDNYDRSKPKIFVGEWATQDADQPWQQTTFRTAPPTPSVRATLGDAAYLTGLERNADVVEMAAYAPLLVNVNPGARQWAQNLIGYNALSSFGSPSYYMQAMFNHSKGDVVLPFDLTSVGAPLQAPALPHGAVGVGTWHTQAEFKDASVTKVKLLDSETQRTDALTSGTDSSINWLERTIFGGGWKAGRGTWKIADGDLVQSGNGELSLATAGDTNWMDYTYSVKARKISGAEGFLIPFHVQDSDNLVWWNIGGWNNTRTALERIVGGNKSGLGQAAPVTVETGRWYDIRIEVRGRQIRCFLDDKLITEAVEAPPVSNVPIYASVTRDLKRGDIILKVVNVAATPQQIQFNLQGVPRLANTATVEVLSGQPMDVNTVEMPEKVAPHTFNIVGVGPTFGRTFPAYSVSVLRLRAR